MALFPDPKLMNTGAPLGLREALKQPPLPELPVDIMEQHRDPFDGLDSYVSPSGALITTNEDGSVSIDFGGPDDQTRLLAYEGFYENLADDMVDSDLAVITSDLLEGIEADLASRSEWEDAREKGIELLGLKLEDQGTSTQNSSVSKVYHPVLMEAVVKYQANAAAELLPTAGPVKVRDDQDQSGLNRSDLAEKLEKDMNHYLTVVAKEYVPDTERMFFRQGLEGLAFKKVFHCPIRRRPASDYVAASDLIVSNDATDLSSCGRKTHRLWLRQSVMKRMQILGVYRDITLDIPTEQIDNMQAKIKDAEGSSPTPVSGLTADQRHEVYESYVELILPGDEDEDGLPRPYRVSIDRTSQKILEIRRNWKEEDENFQEREVFVKYPLIPGMGFYDYGFGHLLGNSARSLTAVMRQLLDAGMFANFPGFLRSKFNSRQTTSQIRIQPGGSAEIETGGLSIKDAVMPLPYKEPSRTLFDLAVAMAQEARALAGTVDLPVGDGKADIPVGTILALIEQSTKVQGAIHRRNHAAQQREFQLLKDLFCEDPHALVAFSRAPNHQWSMAEEFMDKMLVPASDPNIPSHIHRLMQATAVAQRSVQVPGLYNAYAVEKYLLRTIGIADPMELLNPEPAPGQGAPTPPSKEQEQMQLEQFKAGAREAEQVREQQQQAQRHNDKMQEIAAQAQIKQGDNQTQVTSAVIGAHSETQKVQAKAIENHGRMLDNEGLHIIGHHQTNQGIIGAHTQALKNEGEKAKAKKADSGTKPKKPRAKVAKKPKPTPTE